MVTKNIWRTTLTSAIMILYLGQCFGLQITFNLESSSELKEKMAVWICTNPNTNMIGETKPLLKNMSPLTLDLDCPSFGFFSLDPQRTIGKYVDIPKSGINTLNYFKDTTCELTFNGKKFQLDSYKTVNIPDDDILKENINSATISCSRTVSN